MADSSAAEVGTNLKRLSPNDVVSEEPERSKRVKTTDDLETVASAGEIVDAVTSKEEYRPSEKNISRKRDAAGYAKGRKGKEKEGKNPGRRSYKGREDANKLQGEWGPREDGEGSKGPRYPKRLCALLVGFCGTGCKGMQYQPNVRTIEGVLFDAMVKAGAVSQDNANDPSKVNLARAARTDAGVHAAGNLISLKMITAIPGVPDMVSRINEELPPEIRAWGYVRVQNSFNARLACDSRKYTYFFPSYMLIPPKPGCELYEALKEYSGQAAIHPFWSEIAHVPSKSADDMHRKRQWRISSELLLSLRERAEKFRGTHNFHNFTVGRNYLDKSSQRHMKKIEISDPMVYGDTEWISVMLHGQSFMLHQIRKMMSALVLTCRTGTPPKIIDEMYSSRMVHLPKMPSLGLLLENPLFDSYNQKIFGANGKLQPSDPEYRHPVEFENHREKIEEFKQRYIYDNLREIEDRDGVFDTWIRNIDSYSGNDLLYLNSEGVIPEASVIKKGEKRPKPFSEPENSRLEEASMAAGDEDEDEDEFIANKSRLVEMEG